MRTLDGDCQENAPPTFRQEHLCEAIRQTMSKLEADAVP